MDRVGEDETDETGLPPTTETEETEAPLCLFCSGCVGSSEGRLCFFPFCECFLDLELVPIVEDNPGMSENNGKIGSLSGGLLGWAFLNTWGGVWP